MAHVRRVLKIQSELSAAERFWLTGDKPKDWNNKWSGYFLWSLNNGFPSWHRGRSIMADELLEQYGHLVTADRRKLLKQQLKRMK